MHVIPVSFWLCVVWCCDSYITLHTTTVLYCLTAVLGYSSSSIISGSLSVTLLFLWVSANFFLLFCALRSPDARPRLNWRRSFSTVLSQVCLGLPGRRLQLIGAGDMQACRAREWSWDLSALATWPNNFWRLVRTVAYLIAVAVQYAYGIRNSLHAPIRLLSSINLNLWARRPDDVAKTVAVSIVTTRLDYCNSLFFGMSTRNFATLHVHRTSLHVS